MLNRFVLEKSLQNNFNFVIGCDEVGRGALAGPVVAGAVVFEKSFNTKWWKQIDDSKKLSPAAREEIAELIKEHALTWGVAEVNHDQIDEINIHRASLLAMKKSVLNIFETLNSNCIVLVDGKFTIPDLNCDQQSIVGGDAKVQSIAAASILAKVHRDDLMRKLENKFPVYGFAQHKGYATKFHRASIKEHGLSSVHRVSFCGNI